MRKLALMTALVVLPFAAVADGVDQRLPEGFVWVWEDDRLNNKRGVGTAAGEAQMATVWTNTVPRKLVEVPVAATAAAVSSEDVQIYQELGGTYVQVAVFPNANTANVAADRLRELGITARRGVIRKGGEDTPVVLAGPYADASAAGRELAEIRGIGYTNAFIRN